MLPAKSSLENTVAPGRIRWGKSRNKAIETLEGRHFLAKRDKPAGPETFTGADSLRRYCKILYGARYGA